MSKRKKKTKKQVVKNKWWLSKRWWAVFLIVIALGGISGRWALWELAKPSMPQDAAEAMRVLNSQSITYLNQDELHEYMQRTDMLMSGYTAEQQKELAKDNGVFGLALYDEWRIIQQGRAFAFARTQAERDQIVNAYIMQLKQSMEAWTDEEMLEEAEAEYDKYKDIEGAEDYMSYPTSAQEDAYMNSLDEAAAQKMGMTQDEMWGM